MILDKSYEKIKEEMQQFRGKVSPISMTSYHILLGDKAVDDDVILWVAENLIGFGAPSINLKKEWRAFGEATYSLARFYKENGSIGPAKLRRQTSLFPELTFTTYPQASLGSLSGRFDCNLTVNYSMFICRTLRLSLTPGPWVPTFSYDACFNGLIPAALICSFPVWHHRTDRGLVLAVLKRANPVLSELIDSVLLFSMLNKLSERMKADA